LSAASAGQTRSATLSAAVGLLKSMTGYPPDSIPYSSMNLLPYRYFPFVEISRFQMCKIF
ncbi:MAG: hypothetical protein WBZ51_01175, partial [Xanthobacteraceae bacterium]